MEIGAPVSIAVEAGCALGEGPVWDAQRECLWFVDIKLRRLWRHVPASGQSDSFEAPGQIGWALPAEGGLLLCGLEDGLHTFDPDQGAFRFLCAVPGEPASNRLNDACTDPWGRVWFGSMDDSERAPSGRFYVFERGSIRPAGPAGIAITNGPAIAPDGARIYFTDTLARTIHAAPLDENGVGEAVRFVDVGAFFPDSYPDGPVVDAEGHVWTGLYRGGQVARFDPAGRLVATQACPARDLTKIAFGGPDMRTAFVTTATKDLAVGDRSLWPGAGSLLAFPAPVAGFAPALARLA